jgi:hypothetical protein
MYYQLPDGRILSISIYEYLEMDEQEFKELSGFHLGFCTNDPLFGSAIRDKSEKEDIYDVYDPSREIPEEFLNDKVIREFFDEDE